MKYLVKIFTPEFKTKVDAYIASEVKAKLERDNVPMERHSFLRSFEEIRQRDYLNLLWNGGYKNHPKVEEYYKSVGLFTPEFQEIVLESAERGYQSRARVMWNGEVRKIDDIDEIFSYKSVEDLQVQNN